MELKIIDSHAHLHHKDYNKDRDEVVKRCFDEGVGVISAGVDIKSSIQEVALSEKYGYGIWAMVGIHPTESSSENFDEISNLAKNKNVVGIGECGLDYYRNNFENEKKRQIELFEKHIKLSFDEKKPIVIHCREAFGDIFDVLGRNKKFLNENPGIFHFFTGTIDDVKKAMELGFSFTFGGLTTFNRSFDEVIKYISIDRVLVETDSPFVSPMPHRGERNEPVYIKEVVKFIAEILGIEVDIAEKKIFENTKKLFKL